MDSLGGLAATCYGTYNEACASGGVARGEYAGYARHAVLVDLDVAALVELHAEFRNETLVDWREEAHAEEDELSIDGVGRLRLLDHLGATVLALYPLNLYELNLLHLAVLADEALGIEAPTTVASLFVATGGLEDGGPVRPWIAGSAGLAGLRHNLDLHNRARLLAVAGAYAVRTGVAAANDEDGLASGQDAVGFLHGVATVDVVLLLEELESEVYALELTALNLEVAGLTCADGNNDGVEVLAELVELDVDAHVLTGLESDALSLEDGEAAVDDLLRELEVGDAEAEETADGVVLLEDGDRVARLVEEVGASETCGAATDYGYFLASAVGGYARLNYA